ncbi:MarR family winged helix-turn-helix transcriptional regulator [Salinisphaera sp. LB1]|uniref:MarR family winged helix-turn-helix transcriptional regulator n=1 Tax=Salinisphaera sp. LB1 TaxID=2183911 RepID=UPI000D7068B8|nr:MarR family transcriptional regulator [Salinisphaera sp. LB1]AWN16268.1 Organic hydroperoxide resistance transcriptional regulator [Salinisphaera sp. LB1]
MTAQSAPADAEFPALDEQLCFALYTATHRITRAYRPLLEPLGLTYVQYLVMLVLWESAPRSVGELGHSLYLDSGTLTPLLKRMEKSGLVTRQRDNNDERRVLIYLTDQGLELKSQAHHIQADMLCRMELTRAESRQLQAQVMELIDNLEKN